VGLSTMIASAANLLPQSRTYGHTGIMWIMGSWLSTEPHHKYNGKKTWHNPFTT
jgi:hypothetical protein